ncbi:hypothetical protein [Streptomyces sp. H39-C1]|uniref:hypothetical protein n=1 Tax=Streptomyces sp. H39-C1 TaxID=3004355 RepID=UPI0022AF2ABB|nr:hypothetical protein [Streptomyces sp. H39-C1]MCZ4098039.1 hypothetical protein [Streptomyces sp. H39-C1]
MRSTRIGLPQSGSVYIAGIGGQADDAYRAPFVSLEHQRCSAVINEAAASYMDAVPEPDRVAARVHRRQRTG